MTNFQHKQSTESIIRELPYFEGVCFDPDLNTIYGNYLDELSCYRAKKSWKDAVKLNFDLEEGFDYILTIEKSNRGTYLLSCRLISASGKYSFWKITNNQSPEVQYILETAHIPICDNRYEDILKAPDMRSIYDLPLRNNLKSEFRSGTRLHKILKKVLDQN